MIVQRQSDLVNTKDSILPVCYKPYHTNKNTEWGGDKSFAELCIAIEGHSLILKSS